MTSYYALQRHVLYVYCQTYGRTYISLRHVALLAPFIQPCSALCCMLVWQIEASSLDTKLHGVIFHKLCNSDSIRPRTLCSHLFTSCRTDLTRFQAGYRWDRASDDVTGHWHHRSGTEWQKNWAAAADSWTEELDISSWRLTTEELGSSSWRLTTGELGISSWRLTTGELCTFTQKAKPIRIIGDPDNRFRISAVLLRMENWRELESWASCLKL